jgi:outer membrane protein TolC
MTRALLVAAAIALTGASLDAQPVTLFRGSVPAPPDQSAPVTLSFDDAIARGLRYNLGVIESEHVSAEARAGRLSALAALLPTISVRAAQVFERLSLLEVGLTLPGLPSVTDPFQYQDARIAFSQSIYSGELRNRHRAAAASERAASFTAKDAHDIVVLTAGAAYLQTQANVARLDTAVAQLASAQELDRLSGDRVRAELAPEIDALRAHVERQVAEQRVITARTDLEKSKATLTRAIGLPATHMFGVEPPSAFRAPTVTEASAMESALQSRADLASAQARLEAAELALRALRAQQQPTFAISGDYGVGGDHTAFNQVYTVALGVSVPIYTGGRIRADVVRAESEVGSRRAEYDDLKGQVVYDIHVAWLDLTSATTSVTVAESNRRLADRALVQAEDRYANGVTNYLEVVQAQESVAQASENYVANVYAVNLARLTLARAMGGTETRVKELFRP